MALVEGVKYGLSSSVSSGGNTGGLSSAQDSKKSLIFVKLTDSALKAIEDYLRSQQTSGQRATLQFLGNDGRINIPSLQAYNSNSFDFSLQSNADIEGPQGSFECIQQCASSSLESMGTLPFKMRIHAKEDIYEATRQRINALEEERLHDCAKEIKNGADVGRKVKKKIIGSIPASLQQRREPSPNFNNHTKPSLLNHNNSNKKLNNGYYTNHNHNVNNNNHLGGHPLNNNHLNHNNLKTSHTNSSSSAKANIANGGDISRRPLRDRLIHLLAVKPCKKPELVTRLNRDGLKDKDKKLMMPLLLQISSMKGNEYFLNRGIWNDVQEDWPFFTEQERQVMKRRKPQNLTPPGSDCSIGSGTSGSSLSPRSSTSGSGHSPPTYASSGNYHSSNANGNGSINQYGLKQNTPNGSQQLYDQQGGNPALKRPGILEGPDNIPNKRQRVSHFKRPNCLTTGAGANTLQQDHGVSPNQIKESANPYQGTIQSQSVGHSSGNRLSPSGNASAVHGQSQKSPRNLDSRTGIAGNNSVPQLILSPPYGGPNPEETGIGNYAPDVWSARNELVGFGSGDTSKLPDSDETDSVDSGNGSSSGSSSSGSASAHHHQSITPTNGRNKLYSSYCPSVPAGQSLEVYTVSNTLVPATSNSPNNSSKPPTPTYTGSENSNGHTIPNRNAYGPCNRVTSTTPGTGLTPQCSPDSQVEAFQQKHEQHQLPDHDSDNDPNLFNARSTSTREKERNQNRNRDRDRDSLNRRERDGKKDKDRDRQMKVNPDPTRIPSYIGKYTKIRTPEERARYKTDFNSEYGEYRNLHHVIDKVSKKFAHLEERLRQQERGSDGYQAVKEEIVNEYYSNKKNRKYQDTKQKFTYLHDKLSHIKRLVVEFDSAHSADQSDYGSRDDDYNSF